MYFDLLINKDFIIIIKGVFGAYKYGGRYRHKTNNRWQN